MRRSGSGGHEGVAVYHLKASYGSRSGGQSARAKSDYIEREGRYAEDAEELEHKEHGNMPEWAQAEPAKYWEAADENARATVADRADRGEAALYAGGPPWRSGGGESPRAPDVQ